MGRKGSKISGLEVVQVNPSIESSERPACEVLSAEAAGLVDRRPAGGHDQKAVCDRHLVIPRGSDWARE